MTTEPDKDENQDLPVTGGPVLSFRFAMIAYAALAGLCLLTLHGDPLYIALLIIGALAIKTWLVEAKKKLD